MKAKAVLFSPEAVADLEWLYGMIADESGPERALGYLTRVEKFCLGLSLGSERGRPRDEIRAGLRIIGFERRMTIAFTTDQESVVILRCFYGGADWQGRMNEP